MTEHLKSVARNIVNQLADEYMETTEPDTVERIEFIKFRQSTNDELDEFVVSLLEGVRKDGMTEALVFARQIISQYVATSEKWRYDRVMWAFAIMLGEIPEDTPEPEAPSRAFGYEAEWM